MGLNEKFFKSAAGGIVADENFAPVIYTGNGSTQSITSLDFQPDLVWIKKRSSASTASHMLFDSVRGVDKVIISNSTQAEYNGGGTGSGYQTSFDSNGFSITSNAFVNQSSETYVAWNWKAGGAAVSNTDGTITSQVSANVDAGFSIVKTVFGSGESSSTVGHGLNEAPTLIIVKRTDAAEDWYVKYNVVDGSADQMRLNTTAASEAALFTTTSTTVIGFGTTGAAHTTIAYCFHSVDGYQKIASYTGNGGAKSITGLGFAPRFVIFKCSSTTGAWIILDSTRGSSVYLTAESSAADASTWFNFTFDSDGWSVNTNNNNVNGSSQTYIYLAIA